jgi:hypothetical protein
MDGTHRKYKKQDISRFTGYLQVIRQARKAAEAAKYLIISSHGENKRKK